MVKTFSPGVEVSSNPPDATGPTQSARPEPAPSSVGSTQEYETVTGRPWVKIAFSSKPENVTVGPVTSGTKSLIESILALPSPASVYGSPMTGKSGYDEPAAHWLGQVWVLKTPVCV